MSNIARSILIAFAALLMTIPCQAVNHTVSGYVRDAKSGEALVGATLYIAKSKAVTAANNYGFYSFTLPQDTQYILISYVGYKAQLKKIYLDRDISMNVMLEPAGFETGTVVIKAQKKAKDNVARAQMGVIDVPIIAVKELPAIFGEKDLLKVLTLLPGVQSGSEGSAGFYVRGGGPDQNLVLLDEAVIYNPFHLAGFFSTFNGDAIKSVSLVKGGFPAQYGGRLSSIIDISMKEGNDKQFHGEGGIGLISSRLMLEGPIIKEKMSFMVSARRTYLDLLIKPLLPKGQNFGYFFYDLNSKLNYKLSDKDRFYLSSYIGSDKASVSITDEQLKFGIDWGNKSLTARWNHQFGNKLFANTTLLYNDYIFSISGTQDVASYQLKSGIRDYSGKIDFDWFPHLKHKVKFGGQYIYQKFIPSSTKITVGNVGANTEYVRFVNQAAIYINDEYAVNEKFAINFGLRAPLFIYKKTQYQGLEPRFTTKYSLNERSSIKAGYTWMNQYVHLVSNSSVGTPMDLWLPCSDIVKPQVAQQVAAGYFRNFHNDDYEASVEVYYKDMRNLIEYQEGAQVLLNPNVDKVLVFGKGQSYGSEFFIKKNEGRITGWAGYTLSWANRTFPGLNNGKTYPAKYDRRHDFSVVAIYNFNKYWSFSAVFIYGSGHSLTVPFGSYNVPVGSAYYVNAQDYVDRNFYKLRPSNRLDIGIKYMKPRKKWQGEWRFDIYNVYSRRNPYFVYIQDGIDPRSNITRPMAKQVSLFPMVPSISYNFKF